ncbi:MAG: GH36-type glycosyl hydrolase domain-containing protein, partial [Candidatus Krumholzibacteriia bacterium]
MFLTAAGTGCSACNGHALTPWSTDPVEDVGGLLVYLRDLVRGTVWTAGLRPLPEGATRCDAAWSPGRATFTRTQDGIESRLEVCVPPGTTAELRRLTVVNRSGRSRTIEVTTCAEVALDDPAACAAHPVFSKLFLQTEQVAAQQALLVRRRARSPGEIHPWLVHALVENAGDGAPECETDRARFVGRLPARGVPRALVSPGPLSGTTGNVLDPVVCLRRTLTLGHGESASLAFLLGAGRDRDEALALATRFAGAARVADAFAAAAADAEAHGEDAPQTPAAPAGDIPPAAPPPPASAPTRFTEPLRFDNGQGGFSEDGTEYVIRLRRRADGGLAVPPRPWINVIANEEFGFLVSETGAGFTWCGNSRERRLTPWSNDPLRDPHGEAFWVRDEATGACWSPLPGPTPGAGDYEMRHGFGYSVCRHESAGLGHETTLFAARHDPVRLAVIRLTNLGARPRELALLAYCRLDRGPALPHGPRAHPTARGASPDLLLARPAAAGAAARGVTFAAVIAPDTAGPVSVTA